MDLETYRRLQDSAWVRVQRDAIAAGEPRPCADPDCSGLLEPYDAEEWGARAGGGPVPGGVRCDTCHARSRAVAL